MAGVNTLWNLAAVVLPVGTITQIVDQKIDHGIEEMMLASGGSLDNEFVAASHIDQKITFTTTAVATALGLVGFAPYAFSSGTCQLWFRKLTQAGTRDDTAAMKLTATTGVVVPTKLTASDDGKEPAKLTFEFHPLSSDGTVVPLTPATGQAFPTIAIASEAFTTGPAKVNTSTTIASINSIDVDFGYKVEKKCSDGYAYYTFAGVVAPRSPTISIKAYDATALSTLGLNGLALTDWTVYFRQIKTGSTRWSDASAKHLKLSGTTGFMKADSSDGSFDKEANINWQLMPVIDGTNAVATVTPNSAIT